MTDCFLEWELLGFVLNRKVAMIICHLQDRQFLKWSHKHFPKGIHNKVSQRECKFLLAIKYLILKRTRYLKHQSRNNVRQLTTLAGTISFGRLAVLGKCAVGSVAVFQCQRRQSRIDLVDAAQK